MVIKLNKWMFVTIYYLGQLVVGKTSATVDNFQFLANKVLNDMSQCHLRDVLDVPIGLSVS